MVKISILDIACPRTFFEEKLTFLEEMGIEGIEITCPSHEAGLIEKRSYFQECLSSSKVQISAIHLCFCGEFQSTLPYVRKRIESFTRDALCLCSDLGGAGVITIPSYKKGTFPNGIISKWPGRKRMHQLIEEYTVLSKYAEEFGVPLMIEPVDHRLVTGTTTCESCAVLCRESGSDLVRLCPDLFHMSVEGEKIPEMLTQYKDLISHLHVCDRDPNNPLQLLPGYGILDFGEILDTLGAIGYHGYHSMDIEVPFSKDSLLRSIDILRRNSIAV